MILRRNMRPCSAFYGEEPEVIHATGWYPEDPADEDDVFDPADDKVTERSFNRRKAQYEGLSSAQEVERVRMKRRLNGKALA
ncbi:hypothetical protein [Falsigemmobacter faecalis]|uniref:Uncharacterized protein n=1 Tax=Falsigemmobacter faecalis TaxID=2488730 RepID=A0A3P3D356_9RHOB|nr:hypothetical protein [Falsigemmobacter faecalis]RRH68853.1 hypothetical protein EG244_19205 [Falsigemmobacter faecalis]